MHPYLRLHLNARPAAGASPEEAPWAAPMLRRVLGKALVEGFCPFGEPHCQPPSGAQGPVPDAAELCRLAPSCPYGRVYAAAGTSRPPLALYTPPPRPDRTARLELTLFGEAWHLYPWLLAAAVRGLAGGVGKQRTPWQLLEIARVHPGRRRETLCGADLTGLPPTLTPDRLSLALDSEAAARPVEVRLLSATRLVHEKRLLQRGEPVPFEALVARILDRFAGLYGRAASELLAPAARAALEAEAARVPLVADETGWERVRDYSARGDKEIHLGGKVGRLVYGAEAARFVPLLQAGEILHVGKNPASGCGRMAVNGAGEGAPNERI